MVHTEDKIAPCGCYYNVEDPSICVCARDPMQCNKSVPAPNLATIGGKCICLLLVSVVAAVVVLQILRPWHSGDTKDDR